MQSADDAAVAIDLIIMDHPIFAEHLEPRPQRNDQAAKPPHKIPAERDPAGRRSADRGGGAPPKDLLRLWNSTSIPPSAIRIIRKKCEKNRAQGRAGGGKKKEKAKRKKGAKFKVGRRTKGKGVKFSIRRESRGDRKSAKCKLKKTQMLDWKSSGRPFGSRCLNVFSGRAGRKKGLPIVLAYSI
jgi:hypothetical protein